MAIRSSLSGGNFVAHHVANHIANHALGTLSEQAFAQLVPHLHKHVVAKGTVLWSGANPHGSIVFPLSGVVSIVRTDTEGRGVEVGFAGRESAVGFSAQELTRGIVQVGGVFVQVVADRFWAVASERAELRTMAASCQDWMLVQARVLAACNAVHDLQARLCRWLLQISDRTASEIPSTQEEIAQLLGVQRTTTTLVAHRLQDEGIIRNRRGRIEVRDRARLLELTCGCYHDLAALRPLSEPSASVAVHYHPTALPAQA